MNPDSGSPAAGRASGLPQIDDLPGRGSPGQTILAGWLVDGSGGPVQKEVCIRLCGESVAAVDAKAHKQVRTDQIIVDLSDMTVLPALIDAHVHLALPGPSDLQLSQCKTMTIKQQIESRITNHLCQHARCGIVAVRDGGDCGAHVLRFKKQGLGADVLPMDLVAAGWAWHAPGRYGRAIGRSPRHPGLLAETLQGLVTSFDHLKVIQSGMNSLDHFGRQTQAQFSMDQMLAAVALARAHGKPVMVHANGTEPVRMAIEAGCSSIEHGYFMGTENLHRMADKGIWWVPTVQPMARLGCNYALAPEQRDVACRTRDHQLQQISRAVQLGVHIALGTDAGSPGVEHGHSVREEMQWLISAGMSLELAVRCASLEAAALIGWTRRGAVLPGFRADLIAVRGQPHNLPQSLESLEAICLKGQWHAVEKAHPAPAA